MTPNLGIIEGYFGRSWSWTDRKTVISTLAPVGYKFFHYAPKIDPKLRRDWKVPHDAEAINHLTELSSHCKDEGVQFGIGLTPYDAHLDFNAEAKAALKAKVMAFNSIGIDDLVILFDDMRGDIPDLANRQAEIISFCVGHSKASRVFTCPSYYSDDPVLDRVFGARPENYLQVFGKLIDRKVQVYWTGEEVCSAEISPGHLRDVADRLNRKVCLWDNYPVNDGPRMSNYLHLRGVSGRSAKIASYLTGHAINPASQPFLGCIPAVTLAQNYQLGGDYCYGKAFISAATQIVGTELATLLQKDILNLQNVGLDRLEDRKAILRERYAAINHPAAAEIVDWLDGGYAITGEMLQTQ
jgi:hyaluronoglucosaminidase